jgi:nucleoside-diphosphate-sugar epimerase
MITTESQLEERLSRPMPATVEAMRALEGDLLVLGAGGKMGPSLVRLARRSADEAGRRDLRVIAVSRYSTPGQQDELQRDGIETIPCDLLDEAQRRALPESPNVLFMFGHKFSDSRHLAPRDDSSREARCLHSGPERYWAMNVYLPALLAEQYRSSRIVAFSSGNIYPFTKVGEPAPKEGSTLGPIGEYASTVLGRERMLEYASIAHSTPVCLLRLNYAVEARYGVLVDLAEAILARRPISLAVPEVNFIWQGYANAVALRSFPLAASPAGSLNLTGAERHRVRDLAERLGRRLGVEPVFADVEGDRALVSDASRCRELFGASDMDTDELIELTATWLESGGHTLGKPTKFQVTDGRF